MKYYYYHRDRQGYELFYQIENEVELFDDFQKVIDRFTPKDETPIVEIYKACKFGQAESFLEFVEKELLPSGEADANWVVAALIGEVKYGYPFAVIEHVDDGRFEVCAAKDVPWQKLILELGKCMGFQVGPIFLSEEEIDSKKAFEMGFNGLGEMLKLEENANKPK